MRCEICGKKIIGEPIKTKIESSIMSTCNECAKFGKVQREPPKPRRQKPFKRSPRIREPVEEVIEEYNIIIREAREKKGWSRENLAEKIYEKASVINRIETGKMVPDIRLAKKLERLLNIKLIEKSEDIKLDDLGHSSGRGATIGDIARIKRN
ncbi:MAG: TIGR00270 family protein [Methanobacterium sp.]|uniref:multiprotein bridging factor aMBF1 n=1 Tax=Methanobacterium sp. TaxID=2164 RepID=UPI003D6554B9|nr:TIGR00270 family protein [Methanobacterium sp.]